MKNLSPFQAHSLLPTGLYWPLFLLLKAQVGMSLGPLSPGGLGFEVLHGLGLGVGGVAGVVLWLQGVEGLTLSKRRGSGLRA